MERSAQTDILRIPCAPHTPLSMETRGCRAHGDYFIKLCSLLS